MKIRIGKLDVEVVSSNEEIIRKKMPLVCVPLNSALMPLDQNYPAGTRSCFLCSLCGQNCILAPSDQNIVAAGENPIFCMDCMIRSHEA